MIAQMLGGEDKRDKHAVEISDDGTISRIALDGVPIRGVTGYRLSHDMSGNLEIEVRILAKSVATVDPSKFGKT